MNLTAEKDPEVAYSSALTLAHSVLIASGIASVAWCLYSTIHQKSHLYVRLGVAMIGIAAPLLLILRPTVRLIAAAVFIGLGVGLYSAQLLALVLIDPERPQLQAMEKEAKAAGIPYDGRTRLQAIMDLRRRGIAAYPPFYPYLLLNPALQIDGEPTIALGNIANVTAVACNEGGQYLTYRTDEHGFPNPPGSWSKSPVEIAMVGASAAAGECVPPPDSLLSQLRVRYPRTMTVGAGGNGPLLELASIREYLPLMKPQRVLWIFAESHTPEYLETESESARLLRYLDRSYRQRLLEKQNALNDAITGYFDNGIQGEQATRTWTSAVKDFAMLKSFRTLMYYYVTAQTAKPTPFQFKSAVYEQALSEGQRTVAGWGGTVIIVYWPDSSRYVGICNYTPQLRQLYDRTHEAVLKVAGKLNIPVIDLSRSFPDLPRSQSIRQNTPYFYPYPAHYKPAGYRLAAREILSALEKK